jgi:predicted HTH transcriptional regulator
MIREMEQMGMEPPVFEEFAFMVRVTLRNNLERRGLKLAVRAATAKEMPELNQRQRALLTYLQEHELASRLDYERMFGVSTRTAKSDLQALVIRGLIQKVGRAQATRYQRA